MSKNKNKDTPAQTHEAEPVETPTPEAVMAPPVSDLPVETRERTETVLGVVPPAALVHRVRLDNDVPFDPSEPGAFVDLGGIFTKPGDKKHLKRLKHISDEEILEAAEALDPVKKKAFTRFIEALDPSRLGIHTDREDARIFNVKIYHGTGNDKARPKLTPVGGMYATNGKLLCVGNVDNAELAQSQTPPLPITWNAYVIGTQRRNILWPPKDDKDEARTPICRSIDQVMGDKYGACEACTYRPFKDGKPNDCRSEVAVWLCAADFSGFYEFIFNGTNSPSGWDVVKAVGLFSPTPWSQAIAFGTEENTDETKKKRWFTTKFTVQSSPQPTEAEDDLLRLLAMLVETRYFWPTRVKIWRAAERQAKKEIAARPSTGIGSMLDRLAAQEPAAPSGPAPDASSENL